MEGIECLGKHQNCSHLLIMVPMDQCSALTKLIFGSYVKMECKTILNAGLEDLFLAFQIA